MVSFVMLPDFTFCTQLVLSSMRFCEGDGETGNGRDSAKKKAMTTNPFSKLKAQANSTQQTLKINDVILSRAYDGSFCVMPVDKRHTEFFRCYDVALVSAETFAQETGGRVINMILLQQAKETLRSTQGF